MSIASHENHLRVIGLTGGIAMGKSQVSHYLSHVYQLPILDADLYARQAVLSGSPILEAMVSRYGTEILQSDGTLNRNRLSHIIFTHATERTWVESQIHPWVRDRLTQDICLLQTNQGASTIVVVIPLLVEAKMTNLASEIWLVNCPVEHQLNRLMQRDSLTIELATNRIRSQLSFEEKCQRIPQDIPIFVLNNSSTLSFLYQQVDSCLRNVPHQDPINPDLSHTFP